MSRCVLVQIPGRPAPNVYRLDGLAAEVVGCVATMKLSPRTLALLLLVTLNDRQLTQSRTEEANGAEQHPKT